MVQNLATARTIHETPCLFSNLTENVILNKFKFKCLKHEKMFFYSQIYLTLNLEIVISQNHLLQPYAFTSFAKYVKHPCISRN